MLKTLYASFIMIMIYSFNLNAQSQIRAMEHVINELSLRNLTELEHSASVYLSLRERIENNSKANNALVSFIDTLNYVQTARIELINYIDSLENELKSKILNKNNGGKYKINITKSELRQFWFGDHPIHNAGEGDGNGWLLLEKIEDYIQIINGHYYTFDRQHPEYLILLTCNCKSDDDEPLYWIQYHFKGDIHRTICSLELIKLSLYQIEELLLDVWEEKLSEGNIK